MSLEQHYILDTSEFGTWKIKKFRGKFRDQSFYDDVFKGSSPIVKEVYNLLEEVYNKGEDSGRDHIRTELVKLLRLNEY